jgi:hypothetical protein
MRRRSGPRGIGATPCPVTSSADGGRSHYLSRPDLVICTLLRCVFIPSGVVVQTVLPWALTRRGVVRRARTAGQSQRYGPSSVENQRTRDHVKQGKYYAARFLTNVFWACHSFCYRVGAAARRSLGRSQKKDLRNYGNQRQSSNDGPRRARIAAIRLTSTYLTWSAAHDR